MKDGTSRKVGKDGGREITLGNLMKKNLIGTLTVLYRREVLDSYLNEVLPVMPKFRMGDIPFWLYMASKGKIRELPYDTACYRILQSSVSHSTDFISSYEFRLDTSRLRLWMNDFLGTHYSFKIKFLFKTGKRNAVFTLHKFSPICLVACSMLQLYHIFSILYSNF